MALWCEAWGNSKGWGSGRADGRNARKGLGDGRRGRGQCPVCLPNGLDPGRHQGHDCRGRRRSFIEIMGDICLFWFTVDKRHDSQLRTVVTWERYGPDEEGVGRREQFHGNAIAVKVETMVLCGQEP